MKSMVQEGSSVAKAIDKAWELAGKPSEFTIKVMQVEERNFFGMVKKSAVVSIVYEPRISAEAKPVRQPRSDQRQQSRHRNDDSRSSHNYQNNDHGQRERKETLQPREIQQPQAREQQSAQQAQPRPPRQTRPMNNEESLEVWSEHYVPLINDWLKEILANMHISATFTTSLDRQLLRVQFDAPVIESADEERLVFSSLVSLLMQFLRHKERKRLNGLRIGIYSTR